MPGTLAIRPTTTAAKHLAPLGRLPRARAVEPRVSSGIFPVLLYCAALGTAAGTRRGLLAFGAHGWLIRYPTVDRPTDRIGRSVGRSAGKIGAWNATIEEAGR